MERLVAWQWQTGPWVRLECSGIALERVGEYEKASPPIRIQRRDHSHLSTTESR